jgi:uncharacterized protein YciI
MKTFLVILNEKSSQRIDDNLLHKHIEHLKQLTQDGHLLICGPFVDNSGAMLVFQAASDADVEALIQTDPFIQENFYGRYSITEFYKADASNNYLMSHQQTLDELDKK